MSFKSSCIILRCNITQSLTNLRRILSLLPPPLSMVQLPLLLASKMETIALLLQKICCITLGLRQIAWLLALYKGELEFYFFTEEKQLTGRDNLFTYLQLLKLAIRRKYTRSISDQLHLYFLVSHSLLFLYCTFFLWSSMNFRHLPICSIIFNPLLFWF